MPEQDDKKDKLNINKSGGTQKQAGHKPVPTPAPGKGIVPPPNINIPAPGVGHKSVPTPAPGKGIVPPPNINIPAPGVGHKSVPTPAPGKASIPSLGHKSVPTPAPGKTSIPSLGHKSIPTPAPAQGFIPPPSVGIPSPIVSQTPGIPVPGLPGMPGQTQPKTEIETELVVRKLVDDGIPIDEKEVGKVKYGHIFAILSVAVVFGIFGSICGEQISRAKRTNMAIDSATELLDKITQTENSLKELKSRIEGAKNAAMDSKQTKIDFELIDYLKSIENKNPFTATEFISLYYQSLTNSETDLFNYYRSIGQLWSLMKFHVDETTKPEEEKILKEWSNNRTVILSEFGSPNSGYGFKMKKEGNKIISILGKYSNLQEDLKKNAYVAEWEPANGGEKVQLKQFLYYENCPDLDSALDEWLVIYDQKAVIDQGKKLMIFGGPLIAKKQRPYLRYVGRLFQLEKALQDIEGIQNNLKVTLGEVSQEERRFFGL